MIVAQRPRAYEKPYAERMEVMAKRAVMWMNYSFKGWEIV